MLLNQLVRINEEGLVADAVNFKMMADSEKNLLLCRGFVFNYDPSKPKESTLGVLDAVRRSYHSRNEANVHLIVQGYGTGKSHFGLVLANFFKQPSDSPEVQGILNQVEIATSGSSNAILQDLKAYKQRSKKHLVICIRDDGLDLKQMFLRSVRDALLSEGIAESLAQQICHTPLRYLEGLTPEQRAIADRFLERTENPNGDVSALIELLRQDNYRVIATVKELSRELTGGFAIDFDADLKIEAILEDLLNTLCGETSRFQGILILFDELNYYLESWATNPIAAGGPALQNITNVCENHKGRIALVCFTQIKPSNARAIPYQSAEDYRKLTSRLELGSSTYEPASSLELVINGLLSQQTNTAAWQKFRAKWDNTLRADSTIAYEKLISTYRHQRNWSFQKFHDYLTLGCFPLHPLTSYLLCNLDFAQGRTAIQFIKKDVKNFILEQPVEKDNNLNYIHPVVLADAFEDNNFSNYSIFAEYKRSYDSIVASANPDEITVLKAVFLFYASGGRIKKLDWEKHEAILIHLTGMSVLKVKESLEKLCQIREVIYHKPEDNTYRFFPHGAGLSELRQRIKEEISDQPTSISKVELYCQGNIVQYLGTKTILATQFVEQNKLISSDWLFECKISSAERFKTALLNNQILRNVEERGIVVYVIAETSEELLTLRNNIEGLLFQSPIKNRVVVAIPSQATGDLAHILLMLDTVKNKSSATKQQLGAALSQLHQQLQQQVDKCLTDMFSSCTYHCSLIEKIPSFERNNPQFFVSTLLQDLYSLVPPVEKIDKMALKSPKGSEIIGYVSKRLLDDDLSPQKFPNKSYKSVVDPVFVECWRLLRTASQKYSVVEPTQRNVKAAWNKISEMTALDEHSERFVEIARIWETLSQPPYGYNEYTFTILFAAWLAHHRAEVALRGEFGIPQKKSERVSVYTRPIKDWAITNVLDKPKDFIHEWVEKERPQLIRRKPSPCPEVPDSVDYEQAQQLIQEIDAFLNYSSAAPDPAKVSEISKKRDQLNAGVEQIDAWFQPVVEAESLTENVNIEPLVRLMPSLQRQLPTAIAAGVATVRPTEPQRIRQAQALQATGEKIEHIVDTHSKRSKSLITEEACDAYKAETERMINQLSQVSGVPSHLINTLQYTLRAVDMTSAALKEQAKVKECLSQIQTKYNALSNYATQQDYTRTRSEVEALAQNLPLVNEEKFYQQTLQDLEQRYNDLTQQVEIWSERFAGIERSQALKLVNEINRQLNRFTEEASKQRLNTLLGQLNDIVLGNRDQAEVEKSVRAVGRAKTEKKLVKAKKLPLKHGYRL